LGYISVADSTVWVCLQAIWHSTTVGFQG